MHPAGHSLGGALSPTLALAALDQKSEWSGGKEFTISVYPSAGPTPGNEDFATYYDSRLGENTTRIWNNIDIVPHAWNEEMLSEIPSLYQEGGIYGGLAVRLLVKTAKRLAKGGNYTQIVDETPGLEGKVKVSAQLLSDQMKSSNSTFIDDKEVSQVIEELEDNILKDPELQRGLYLSNDIKNDSLLTPEQKKSILQLFRFMTQALYQHTDAYAELLDVKETYDLLFEDRDPKKCPDVAKVKEIIIEHLSHDDYVKDFAE
ncbi:MAG: lipase family protein [Moorea sp. SIO4A3]|nr:lipase family protein [Moorena sp. SIO4A3]